MKYIKTSDLFVPFENIRFHSYKERHLHQLRAAKFRLTCRGVAKVVLMWTPRQGKGFEDRLETSNGCRAKHYTIRPFC